MSRMNTGSDRRPPREFVPIHSESPRRVLAGAVIILIAAFAQLIGLVRYIGRLPRDLVGIGLYVSVACWLLVMALMLFRKWRRLRTGGS